MTAEITVGLTEFHGIAAEAKANPPLGVSYTVAESTPSIFDHILRSPAKGVLHRFNGDECDILEAPLFPIRTRAPWVFTPAGLAGATTFNLLGVPLPRSARVKYLSSLMLRPNFKRLVFKSNAGAKTMHAFARITDRRLLDKVSVVYPAIRKVDDALICNSDNDTKFLFSGEFFRKGGANVVDAFIRLQHERDDVSLRVCSDIEDFRYGPVNLRESYLRLIQNNDAIEFGSVSRTTMMNEIYPSMDVLVSPAMSEAFGFALLEASAYGIPVISTNVNAIPEIVHHEKSGLLINVDKFDFVKRGRYGALSSIDPNYHDYVSEMTYTHMKHLAENKDLRLNMGYQGLQIARSKFSFDKRNEALFNIYKNALA